MTKKRFVKLLEKEGFVIMPKNEFEDLKTDFQNLKEAYSCACEIIDNMWTCPYDIKEFDRSHCPTEDSMECDHVSRECWERWFLQPGADKVNLLGRGEDPEPDMTCKVCGCSWFNPCPGGCSWFEPELCSACSDVKWILNNSTSDYNYKSNIPELHDKALLYCIENETRKSGLAMLLREARKRGMDVPAKKDPA